MELSQVNMERLPGLDFLRVFSVFCVIFSHADYTLFRGLGVPLLLALSGFLITRNLINEPRINIAKFWKKRVYRIAPAYFAFVILAFSIDYYVGDEWSLNLTAHALTHSINYYNAINGHPTFTGSHIWTLSLLEQFYFLYPILLSISLFRKNIFFTFLTLVILANVWRCLVYFQIYEITHVNAWIYNSLDTRIDSLIVGGLAAYFLYRHEMYVLKYKRLFIVLVPFLSIIGIYVLKEYKHIHYTVGFTLEAVLAVFLIISFANLAKNYSLYIIDNKLITFLAKISFPMYLYHSIAFGVSNKFLDNEFLIFLVGVFLTMFLGFMSYNTVEKYFLTRRNNQKFRLSFR